MFMKCKSIGYDVVGQTSNGWNKKAPKVLYNETSPKELISYFKPRLQSFVTHNFIAKWQDHHFKLIFMTIPNGSIISCVDFFQNYTMWVKNEIQSMHWYNIQISIFVHLTYRLDPLYILGGEMPKVIKKLHYYISYDTFDDIIFVQHCFIMHWKFLSYQGCIPIEHIMNDGCSGQFKSKITWYFWSHYPSLTTFESCPFGCQMIWNFFVTRHEKNKVDGFGALLKRKIIKE